MALMSETRYNESLNILASEVGLVTETHQAEQKDAETVGNHKIIKAGSLWSGRAGTADAIGVVFEDVDMTNDEKRPMAVVVAGRLRADRVAAEVVAKKEDLIKQGLYLIEKED